MNEQLLVVMIFMVTNKHIHEVVYKMAASSEEVVVSYVGQKVSKVRWAPVLSGRRTSEIFVSGSWDDPVSDFCMSRKH